MTERDAAERFIVALDVPTAATAYRLVEQLAPIGCAFKVGLELLYAAGPNIVSELADRGLRVFADAKLHDIPATVRGAARALAARGAWMITVHAAGGEAMAQAALQGVREGADPKRPMPLVVAVTVLTSLDQAAIEAAIGVKRPLADEVVRRAELIRDWGLDGLVCSPQELRALKPLIGSELKLVTPGIRPQGAAPDDQARVAGAGAAVRSGADWLVVGRPVHAAPDPAAALQALIAEVAS